MPTIKFPIEKQINKTVAHTRDGSLMSLQEEDENKPDPIKRLMGSPKKAGKTIIIDEKAI